MAQETEPPGVDRSHCIIPISQEDSSNASEDCLASAALEDHCSSLENLKSLEEAADLVHSPEDEHSLLHSPRLPSPRENKYPHVVRDPDFLKTIASLDDSKQPPQPPIASNTFDASDNTSLTLELVTQSPSPQESKPYQIWWSTGNNDFHLQSLSPLPSQGAPGQNLQFTPQYSHSVFEWIRHYLLMQLHGEVPPDPGLWFPSGSAPDYNEDLISSSIGFSNRLLSRFSRLFPGNEPMLERYKITATRTAYSQFVSEHDHRREAIWLEFKGMIPTEPKSPSSEFKNIAQAFFNGEEIFDDGRYMDESWSLGQASMKSKAGNRSLSKIPKDNQESEMALATVNLSHNPPSYPYKLFNRVLINNNSPVISEFRRAFAELLECKTENDRRTMALLIDLVFNTKLQEALKTGSQIYCALKLENMEAHFSHIEKILDDYETLGENVEKLTDKLECQVRVLKTAHDLLPRLQTGDYTEAEFDQHQMIDRATANLENQKSLYSLLEKSLDEVKAELTMKTAMLVLSRTGGKDTVTIVTVKPKAKQLHSVAETAHDESDTEEERQKEEQKKEQKRQQKNQKKKQQRKNKLERVREQRSIQESMLLKPQEKLEAQKPAKQSDLVSCMSSTMVPTEVKTNEVTGPFVGIVTPEVPYNSQNNSKFVEEAKEKSDIRDATTPLNSFSYSHEEASDISGWNLVEGKKKQSINPATSSKIATTRFISTSQNRSSSLPKQHTLDKKIVSVLKPTISKQQVVVNKTVRAREANVSNTVSLKDAKTLDGLRESDNTPKKVVREVFRLREEEYPAIPTSTNVRENSQGLPSIPARNLTSIVSSPKEKRSSLKYAAFDQGPTSSSSPSSAHDKTVPHKIGKADCLSHHYQSEGTAETDGLYSPKFTLEGNEPETTDGNLTAMTTENEQELEPQLEFKVEQPPIDSTSSESISSHMSPHLHAMANEVENIGEEKNDSEKKSTLDTGSPISQTSPDLHLDDDGSIDATGSTLHSPKLAARVGTASLDLIQTPQPEHEISAIQEPLNIGTDDTLHHTSQIVSQQSANGSDFGAPHTSLVCSDQDIMEWQQMNIATSGNRGHLDQQHMPLSHQHTLPQQHISHTHQSLSTYQQWPNHHTAFAESSISLNFECSYCHVHGVASTEVPAWLCTGCGPLSFTCYCSQECLLVDSFTHFQVCLKNWQKLFVQNVPKEFFRYEKFPLYPVVCDTMTPFTFRQHAFFTYCRRSREFPNLRSTWAKMNDPNGSKFDQKWLEMSALKTGDYIIFDRMMPEGFPADPILTIRLRDEEYAGKKAALSRALGVSFCYWDFYILRFLFRLIRELIFDTALFRESGYRLGKPVRDSATAQYDVYQNFQSQFEKEFAFSRNNHQEMSVSMNDPRYYQFIREWEEVRPQIEHFERQNPILLSWWPTTYDIY